MSQFMHLHRIIGTLVLAAFIVASSIAASDSEMGNAQHGDRSANAAPSTKAVLAGGRPRLGMAMCVHHIGDLPLYLQSIDEIADFGANWLLIVTPWYQEFADSTTIRINEHKCPTDEQLLTLLQRAKTLGLRTMLMPIVLIETPGEDDWRGTIRPSDWDLWWNSYREFIGHFAELADAADVDSFSIGSELNTTEAQVIRWERIVDHVRDTYSGELTYSANWDRFEKVQFWHLVDTIGVSAYFELQRDDPDAGESKLVRDWAPIRDRLISLATKQDRPLLLSEIGYPTLPWAAAHPWNYVATTESTADPAAQARAWRAFFRAWDEPLRDPAGPLLGFNAYRWDPYHRGESHDTGYGIRGKPACDVVRDAFTKLRSADPPSLEGSGQGGG